MRTSALTFVALGFTLATAQMGSIPSCATGCISQALPASCNLNPQCICADTSFITTISCCVSTACDLAGQQAALGYAKQICAPVGVTNLPTAAGCAATGAASSSGTSAASAATSMSGSKMSSASASVSSAASTGSAVASASASASKASSSVQQQSTGAAPTMGPMGMAGIAALGAFAFL